MLTWPALSATEPGASVVTLVRAVMPPTEPPKVVTPAVLILRFCAPSTVLTKVMLPAAPAPVLARVVSAPKVTASL